MAEGMNKKIQSIFRCTATVRDTASNNGSESNNMIFQFSDKGFLENGRVLLEQRILLFHGKTNHIRCLSVNDLNTRFKDWIKRSESWDDFQYDCVWERRPVLVKFCKVNDRYRERRCEIAIATEMGIHKSVHKLLACCLETEEPVLIYEYVQNGSWLNRVQEEKNQKKAPLDLNNRLRIAYEISHAVAYLHTAFPRPIIYRVLTPRNVLLDENNAAKLTDFSFCVSIPKGKTSVVTDQIIGTLGYVAPEYAVDGKLVEKSDVYSFGVLFLELLTGQRHHGWDTVMEYYNNKKESPDSLMEYSANPLDTSFKLLVRKFVKDNTSKIITGNQTETPNEHLYIQQLQESTDLALRCMVIEKEHRPTMEEVATQLKNIITYSL